MKQIEQGLVQVDNWVECFQHFLGRSGQLHCMQVEYVAKLPFLGPRNGLLLLCGHITVISLVFLHLELGNLGHQVVRQILKIAKARLR